MYTPTDEQLSAYLDQELDAATAARVEQALTGSAELRTRLDALKHADDLARQSLAAIDDQPLSEGVAALLAGLEPSAASVQADQENVVAFPQRRAARAGSTFWRIAATVVMTSTMALWLANRSDETAEPTLALAPVLDQAVTGEKVAFGQGHSALVSLSFQADDGRYCRELFVLEGQQSSRALFCHDGNRWSEMAVEPMAAADSAVFKVATGEQGSVDDAIEALGNAEPISQATEQALIERNWH